MKHQALVSLKDKSKNNKSVICCNFAWSLNGYFSYASVDTVEMAISVNSDQTVCK